MRRKSFRLALRAIGRAGAVEPHEPRISDRVEDGFDRKLERPVRRLRNGEPVGRGDEIFRRQRLAVERERAELQLVAVKDERRRRARGIRFDLELGANRRGGRIERHVEVDGFDEPIGRPIVLKADGTRFFGAHDGA